MLSIIHREVVLLISYNTTKGENAIRAMNDDADKSK